MICFVETAEFSGQLHQLKWAQASAAVLDYSLYIGIVKHSADFIGHAQIEIYAKKFFKGQLEESFKIQSCQKPNENDFLIFLINFAHWKKFWGGSKLDLCLELIRTKITKGGCICCFRIDPYIFYKRDFFLECKKKVF